MKDGDNDISAKSHCAILFHGKKLLREVLKHCLLLWCQMKDSLSIDGEAVITLLMDHRSVHCRTQQWSFGCKEFAGIYLFLAAMKNIGFWKASQKTAMLLSQLNITEEGYSHFLSPSRDRIICPRTHAFFPSSGRSIWLRTHPFPLCWHRIV